MVLGQAQKNDRRSFFDLLLWAGLGALLKRSWGGLGPERPWATLVLGRCYSHAKSIRRGGNRLDRWAAGILFICLHRMHGVTVSADMLKSSIVVALSLYLMYNLRSLASSSSSSSRLSIAPSSIQVFNGFLVVKGRSLIFDQGLDFLKLW